MKILALIPSRFASTRFPGKPLVNIKGKSMIRRVYERSSMAFEDVWVATDDKRISDEVTGFGGKVVMTSEKHGSGTERCHEALDIIEKREDKRYDVIINIQGDEPCISPGQLLELAGCFKEEGVRIATLVKRFSEDEDIFDPNIPKVIISRDNYALCFSRSVIPYVRGKEKESWGRSVCFYKHIGLYGYTRDTLSAIVALEPTPAENAEKLEQLRWLESGYGIKIAVTKLPSFSVDTPEDLERLLLSNIIND